MLLHRLIQNLFPILRKYTRTLENLAANDITLTSEEIGEINEVLGRFEIKGARYNSNTPNLWG